MFCGVDLGTSTSKASLCDSNGALLHSYQESNNASILDSDHLERKEQNPRCILESVGRVLQSISTESLHKIKHLSFTGQMHGVMEWNLETDSYSNLITWEDRRVSSQFISTLPSNPSFPQVHSGYGLASLLFNRSHAADGKTYTTWGSIMDYLTWYTLQGVPQNKSNYRVKTSSQVAHSFGFFCATRKIFDIESLDKIGFDLLSLPEIVDERYVIGTTTRDFFGIPPGCKVYAPLGDTQCAFYSVIKLQPEVYILNLGTSCQLGKVYSEAKTERCILTQKLGQIFPYFEEKKLALVASLNGGNVPQEFAKQWFLPFVSYAKMGDEETSEEEELKKVYEIMVTAGVKSLEDENCAGDRMKLRMPFFTERGSCGSTKQKGSALENIHPTNCNLGQFSLAVHRSVIDNIKNLSSIAFNEETSNKKVIAVGNIFRKNKILEMLVKEEFPKCTISEADSSLGAAQYISHLNNSKR